jgi:thioredoxin-like negative regulator of GroEL
VDAEPKLAGQFGIQSIPTLLLFSSGQIVDQIIGAASRDQLAARLDRALEAAPVSAG